jgi:hypothetical protein
MISSGWPAPSSATENWSASQTENGSESFSGLLKSSTRIFLFRVNSGRLEATWFAND